jgi:hypothetical protein
MNKKLGIIGTVDTGRVVIIGAEGQVMATAAQLVKHPEVGLAVVSAIEDPETRERQNFEKYMKKHDWMIEGPRHTSPQSRLRKLGLKRYEDFKACYLHVKNKTSQMSRQNRDLVEQAWINMHAV